LASIHLNARCRLPFPQSFLRAGCVHLTLEMLQPALGPGHGPGPGLDLLDWVAAALGEGFLEEHRVLLQHRGRACLLGTGAEVGGASLAARAATALR
jgi:hypothetical protein